MAEHRITYVEDRTVEVGVTVNSDGDLVLDESTESTLAVHESSVWCSRCGRLGDDEYEAHGISDCWEVV